RHSFLTKGETFSDKVVKGTEEKKYSILLNDFYTESMAIPKIELMLNGRRNGSSSTNISIGNNKRLISTVNFSWFEGKIINEPFSSEDLSTNEIILNLASSNPSSIYSLTYAKIEYPQKIKFKNLDLQHFKLPVNNKNGYKFELENISDKSFKILDITDKSQ